MNISNIMDGVLILYLDTVGIGNGEDNKQHFDCVSLITCLLDKLVVVKCMEQQCGGIIFLKNKIIKS